MSLNFDTWINENTRNLLSSLSFNGYILAGNSVANLAAGVPLQGDLDLWVAKKKDYLPLLQELMPYYNFIKIYPTMIELISSNDLPIVNIIFTNMNPLNCINSFDMDYARCYYTPKSGIVFGNNCRNCITTKIIRSPRNVLSYRVSKAISYGYKFPPEFWKNNLGLISNRDFHNPIMKPINRVDINPDWFNITDITNVKLTCSEIITKYKKLISSRLEYNLPCLLMFDIRTCDFNLVLNYLSEIILQNPMSEAHYRELSIYNRRVSVNLIYQHDNPNSTAHTVSLPRRNGETIRIDCNKSGSAYITLSYIPEHLIELASNTFDEMFSLHPEQRHNIIMYNKNVEVNRYSQSYLNTPTDLSHTSSSSYMYSGFDTSSNNSELPELFNPYYQYMLSLTPQYNQVIANWYENGDSIACHADCVKYMIPNASIAVMSLYKTDDGIRTLEILPKSSRKDTSVYEKLCIPLTSGLLVIMHGKMQKEFVHGIPPLDLDDSVEKDMRRLSLSFRQMVVSN